LLIHLAISSSSKKWSNNMCRIFTRWKISCFIFRLWRDIIFLAGKNFSFSFIFFFKKKIFCFLFRHQQIHFLVHQIQFILFQDIMLNDLIVQFHHQWKKLILIGLIVQLFECIGMLIKVKRNFQYKKEQIKTVIVPFFSPHFFVLYSLMLCNRLSILKNKYILIY
jgi:hypothetical protein